MKLSVCAKCGYQLLDDDEIFIEAIGKFRHEGPLVGINLQEPISLTHLGCM